MNKRRLPSYWQWKTLEDVATEIVDGPFGSNLKTSDYVSRGIPVLQGKNITDNQFRWFDVRYITEQKAEQLKRSKVFEGDHLMVKIGSIGYSAILDDLHGHPSAIIPANMAKITPDRHQVDDRFLHRWITSIQVTRHLQEVASKTAQPALSLKKIKAVPIPLPPLEEQRRIAAILDTADTLRTKRRQAIAKLDTLLQSTFLTMFGDPVTNPMGWKEVTLGNICIVKGGKRLPKGHDYSEVPTPYRYLRVADINNGKVNLANLKYLKPETQAKIKRYIVNEGDVIISIAGTIGLTVPVTRELDGTNLTENAAKLVAKRPDSFTANYLSHALQEAHAQFQIGAQTGQVTIGKLALFRIQKIKILLPPIVKQREFDQICKRIQEQSQIWLDNGNRLDDLFYSIQQRAFRGDL